MPLYPANLAHTDAANTFTGTQTITPATEVPGLVVQAPGTGLSDYHALEVKDGDGTVVTSISGTGGLITAGLTIPALAVSDLYDYATGSTLWASVAETAGITNLYLPLALTEQAAPASPPAGELAVYAGTDHALHVKTSGGTDTALGSGGGGGTAWQTLTDGSSISWATGSGNGAQVTLGGNRTLSNPTGLTGGQTYTLRVIQDATGGRILSYGTAYYFPHGEPPRLTTTASASDVLVFESDGTNLYFVAFYANTRNTAFDPSGIANCTLWLKADAISASDGDALASWTDSSGNSHTMTQSTAGLKPIYHTNKRNGLPAVTFDASDDTMSGTLSISAGTAFTVFAVFSQATGGSTRRVLQGSSNWLLGQNQGGRWAYYNGGMAYAPEYVIAGQWACLSATQAAAGRGNLYVNGVPMSVSDATGGPGTVYLGAGGAFSEPVDGDVGEVLIYTRQLTQTEMRDVHTYLLRKWGIGIGSPL